jgi:hypothetical protein
MEARRRKYLEVDVEDKPGELFRFTVKMRDAGVNLSALWGFGVGPGRAKIYALATDVPRLRSALEAGGYRGKEHTCFELTGEDKMGVLCETLDLIEGRGINLHAVDAVGVGGRCAAYVWSRDEDVEAIGKLLNC